MPIITPTVLHGSSFPALGGLNAPSHYNNFQVVGPAPVFFGRHIASPPVFYDGLPNTVIAFLTNVGRANCVRIHTVGLSFEVTHFQLGRGGYDPNNPTQSLGPNPADTALMDPVFPSPTTFEPIDLNEYPNASSASFLCRAESGEAIHGIGELGLWAQILWSPIPAEIGTWFLFAVAHAPLQSKTLQHVLGWRVVASP